MMVLKDHNMYHLLVISLNFFVFDGNIYANINKTA